MSLSFQFNVAKYLTGEIFRQDEICQSLFINICCLYCINEGDLTTKQIEELLPKLSHKENEQDSILFRSTLSKLIELKIIKLKGENIKISFLDEQQKLGTKKISHPIKEKIEKSISSKIKPQIPIIDKPHKDEVAKTIILDTMTISGEPTVFDFKDSLESFKNIVEANISNHIIKDNTFVHNFFKQLFLIKCERDKNLKYIWTPKDAVNLNYFIKKVETSIENGKNNDPNKQISNIEIFNSCRLIINNLTDFYIMRYDISIWNSGYNILIQGIRDKLTNSNQSINHKKVISRREQIKNI